MSIPQTLERTTVTSCFHMATEKSSFYSLFVLKCCATHRYGILVQSDPDSSTSVAAFDVVASHCGSAVVVRCGPLQLDVVDVAVNHDRCPRRRRRNCTHTHHTVVLMCVTANFTSLFNRATQTYWQNTEARVLCTRNLKMFQAKSQMSRLKWADDFMMLWSTLPDLRGGRLASA